MRLSLAELRRRAAEAVEALVDRRRPLSEARLGG